MESRILLSQNWMKLEPLWNNPKQLMLIFKIYVKVDIILIFPFQKGNIRRMLSFNLTLKIK